MIYEMKVRLIVVKQALHPPRITLDSLRGPANDHVPSVIRAVSVNKPTDTAILHSDANPHLTR